MNYKFLLCLLFMIGVINGHHECNENQECIVCSQHKNYVFTGSWRKSDAQQDFWRCEETACEKHTIDLLRKSKRNSTTLDPVIEESPQEQKGVIAKLSFLKKFTTKRSE